VTGIARRALLGLITGTVAAPAAVLGQPAPPRIALVVPTLPHADVVGPEPQARPVRYFLQSLADLGWVDGRTIVIERHTLEGHTERAPELFAELIRRKVQLLVVVSNGLVATARRATAIVPIVMLAADPVGDGLVASLARPGGNVTGTDTLPSPEFSQKWLELLKDAAPKASRVAVLTGPRAPNPKLVERQMAEVERAASSLRLQLRWLEIPSVELAAERLATLTAQRPDALLAINSATLAIARSKIIAFAAQHRLPTVGAFGTFAEDGGLLAYGNDTRDTWRRMASYVDRILKGARPADLPVEQPTRLELIVNLKTANTLGLTLPQSLLLRADRVIQ